MFIFKKNLLNLFGEGDTGAAPLGATGGNATASSPGADATDSGVNANSIEEHLGAMSAGSAAENRTNTAAEGNKSPTAEKTREERRKAYEAYISGEGKEFFKEDMQNIVSKRVKEGKELKEQVDKLNPFVEAIAAKYSLAPSDLDGIMKAIQGDRDFYAAAAGRAAANEGEVYRDAAEEGQAAFTDQRLSQWQTEAEGLKSKYPDFDFESEAKDGQFMQLLGVGIGVEAAYIAKHHKKILQSAVDRARAETEKAVVDNIRAKGKRPIEGGANSVSAPQTGYDVRQLTRAQRAEIARQASFGKRIEFK